MTARVGDWYDLTEGAHAIVLQVDGDRALCVDPYDDMRGGWIELPADLKPLAPAEVARRIEGLLAGAEKFDAAAARYEEQARAARRHAERVRGVADLVRLLTANRSAEQQVTRPSECACGGFKSAEVTTADLAPAGLICTCISSKVHTACVGHCAGSRFRAQVRLAGAR